MAVARLVEYLDNAHKAVGWLPSLKAVHACNTSTWEEETGEPEAQGLSYLESLRLDRLMHETQSPKKIFFPFHLKILKWRL